MRCIIILILIFFEYACFASEQQNLKRQDECLVTMNQIGQIQKSSNDCFDEITASNLFSKYTAAHGDYIDSIKDHTLDTFKATREMVKPVAELLVALEQEREEEKITFKK